MLLGVFPLQDLKWVTNDYKLQEEKSMGAQRKRAYPRRISQLGPMRKKGRESRGGPHIPVAGLSSLANWVHFVLLP